jgi:hypothetical protein
MKNGSRSATTLPENAALPFVIPTEAYPDFLLRVASDVHVCGSPQREPHAVPRSPGLDRKSGGAEWRDLRFSSPFLKMFFDRAYPDFLFVGAKAHPKTAVAEAL